MKTIRVRWGLYGAVVLVMAVVATTAAAQAGDGVNARATPAVESSQFYLPLLGRGMVAPLLPPSPPPVSPHPGIPLARFETANFTGPAVCDNCHGDLQDQAANDVTNSTAWRATMMANSATDPLWQAKVSSEIVRHPELRETIETLCSRCHMPMAYTQAEAQGKTPALFGEGFLNPANPLHEAAMDGVSCTLCHQIQPEGLGDSSSFDGEFVIDMNQSAPDRVLYGPYPDPDMIGGMIMRSGAGYDPRHGAHLNGSALCGTCHTLFTPTTDANGQPSEFPEQVPYLEWRHSSYGDGTGPDQECQECHMPAAVGAVSLFGGWPPREPYFQHTFLGGNVTMLKMLQAHVGELNLAASTTDFQESIDRTVAYLQEETAAVDITSVTVGSGELEIEVHVTNKTGHKFPTGFPGRRAWLHAIVNDGAGRVAFESGRPLSHGAVLDNDADLEPAAYEGHHDVITSPKQVQIYEAVMADVEDNVTYTLLDGNHYIKDNRLLPAGFDKLTASAAVAVAGTALGDDDFLAGGDDVTYRVDVSGYSAPFTAKVELLYETVPYAFVRDLRQDSTPQIERLSGYYADADKTASLVTSALWTTP